MLAKYGFHLLTYSEWRRTVSISEASGPFAERPADPFYDPVPVTRSGLAEQSHGGVPDAVVGAQHPAPVAIERQQRPHHCSQRAGQLGGRIVDGNDEVHGRHL